MPITLDGTAGVTSPSYGAVSGTTGTFSGNVTANGLSTELRPLVLGTAQASTSGTSIDFTGIPSWVSRVTVMFDGVSTSGTSQTIIQIGDSGGIENTGYAGTGTSSSASAVASATQTAGFMLGTSTTGATAVRSGAAFIVRLSGNTWSFMGIMGQSDSAQTLSGAGSKTLSATLDRIRITTVGGTDTFDAGSINILYE